MLFSKIQSLENHILFLCKICHLTNKGCLTSSLSILLFCNTLLHKNNKCFFYVHMLRTINKPAKDSRSALHLLEQVETTSSSIRTFLPASWFCVEQFWLFLSGGSIQILGRSDSWSEDILLRSIGVLSEFFLNCKEGKERRGWLF